MADYPYCAVQSKLKNFMSKIRQVGVPNKATTAWLESLGYKSKNDRRILQVMKFIGFVDKSGKPERVWIDYRGKDHKKVLAQALIQSYTDLFHMYPDACARANDDLEHFFSTRSMVGKQVIQKTVSTFKTLCEQSDFSEVDSTPRTSSEPKQEKKPAGEKALPSVKAAEPVHLKTDMGMPEIHIDIQIHISADSSPEQIEQIFSSMAKHLYKK